MFEVFSHCHCPFGIKWKTSKFQTEFPPAMSKWTHIEHHTWKTFVKCQSDNQTYAAEVYGLQWAIQVTNFHDYSDTTNIVIYFKYSVHRKQMHPHLVRRCASDTTFEHTIQLMMLKQYNKSLSYTVAGISTTMFEFVV